VSRKDFGYFVIMLIAMLIAVSVYLSFIMKDNEILEEENIKLQQQLQSIQQQKAGYTEGKYTLITNLSSSIYLNRIPNNFDKIYPWEDVNGVKGFDTISGELYLRYVEGHIQWPQLALYAPNMHMEVVSETKWPKEDRE
jgi:type II secretory pathway pseudopilin PulG